MWSRKKEEKKDYYDKEKEVKKKREKQKKKEKKRGEKGTKEEEKRFLDCCFLQGLQKTPEFQVSWVLSINLGFLLTQLLLSLPCPCW